MPALPAERKTDMKRWIVVVAMTLASSALADATSDARAVEEAFVAAANIQDPQQAVQAVLKNFTEDAQYIGVFGQVHGKAEFNKVLPVVFSAPNQKTELLSHEAFALDGSTLVSISHLANSFTGPDGKTVKLNLRCVRTMKKQKDGRYLIAVEHTSVGAPPPPAPAAAK
jgi:uncharacterized protein (TIGR02246 family)